MARELHRKTDRHRPREEQTEEKEQSSVAGPSANLLKKDHLIAKVIPLSVSTSREAQKTAEKAIDAVIAAICHVFTEGDVDIPNFGILGAAKGSKGEVRVTLVADSKLKKCAEARLLKSASPPAAPSSSQAAPTPATVPQTMPTTEPSPTVESSPAPASSPQPMLPQAPELPIIPPPAPPDTQGNVALGKPVFASGGLPGQEAEKMLDGDPSTRWVSGHAVPAWAVIDLGQVHNVRKIVVRMPQDAPCAYKLQYTAGGPWILLAEMGMGPHPEEVLDVNFQARQVQLWISESGAQLGWAQVIELEIHGQPV
jgi:hypothetical protein